MPFYKQNIMNVDLKYVLTPQRCFNGGLLERHPADRAVRRASRRREFLYGWRAADATMRR